MTKKLGVKLEIENQQEMKNQLNGIRFVDPKTQMIYKELITLQREEYKIKEKLIRAESQHKQILESKLNNIKQQKKEVAQLINQEGVSNKFSNNKLLREREDLTNHLQMKETENDGKMKKDLGEESSKSGLKNIFSGFSDKIKDRAMEEFKEGIKTVYELDSSLSNINLTMNKSQETFNNMGKSAIGLSKKLHTSLDSTTKAMGIYSDPNASTEEVLNRSKSALTLSNLAGSDVGETAKGLNGMLYEFDENSGQTSHLTDVVTKLASSKGGAFSQNVQEMMNSVSMGGSAAHEAGLEVEQFLSLVSSISEKSNMSGETVSTGLNEMFSRISKASSLSEEDMRKVEKAYSDIGVKLKGNNGQFRNMWDIITDLNSAWGNMTDKQRSYIAEESAGASQKKVFLTMMNNMTSIQDNYNKSMNAEGFAYEKNEAYANSLQGKLQDLKNTKDSIWINTINSDGLKTLVSDFTSVLNIVGKVVEKVGILPTIMTGISIGEKLKDKGFIEDLGKLNSFKDASKLGLNFDNVKKKLTKLKGNAKDITKTFRTTAASTNVFKGALSALGVMVDLTKIKMIALKATVTALKAAVTFGISLLIEKAISMISDIVHRNQKLKESTENILSSFKENTTENNDMISYLENEGKAYDELSEKTVRTADEQKKLNDIKNRIADRIPEVVQGYDDEGNAILKQNMAVKDYIELLKEKNDIERYKLISSGDDAFKVAKNEAKKWKREDDKIKFERNTLLNGENSNSSYYQQLQNNVSSPQYIESVTKHENSKQMELNKLEKRKGELIQQKDQSKADKRELDAIEKEIKDRKGKLANLTAREKVHLNEKQLMFNGINPIMRAYLDVNKDLKEEQKKFTLNAIKLTPEDLINIEDNNMDPIYEKMENILYKIQNEPEFNRIVNATTLYNPTSDQYDQYIQDIKTLSEEFDLDQVELMQSFKINPKCIDDYIKDVKKQIKGASKENKKELEEKLNIAQNIKINLEIDEQEQLQYQLEEAKKRIDELKESVNKSFSNTEKYSRFLKELESNGKLSSASLKEVILSYPQLISCLDNEESMRENLNKLLFNENENNKKHIKDMLENDNDLYNNRILTNKKLVDNMIKLYNIDLNAYTNIAQAKMEIQETILKSLNSTNGDVFEVTSYGRFEVNREKFEKIYGSGKKFNLDKYIELQKEARDKTEHYRLSKDEIDNAFNESTKNINFDKILEEISSIGSSAEDNGDKVVDTVNQIEKSMSKTEEQILKVEQSLKLLENTMNRINRKQEKLNEHSKAYRDILREKQKTLKEEINLLEKQISLNERLRDNPSERNGYDPKNGGSSLGNQVVQEANKYLGTPYLTAGVTPDGFDCSGFVQYVYRQIGKEISRTTWTQFEEGTPVNKNELQPGDLVFFENLEHVGMYTGNGQVIHSPQPGESIKYSNIDSLGSYSGARRIIQSGNVGRSTYSGPYANEINKAANAYGIDPNLLAAIAKVESGFNQLDENGGILTSRAGAQGLFQFMPATATQYGVDVYNVQSAANGAAKYLQYLINYFGGNLDKAIMAYNGGEGAIGSGNIDKESIDYLPKVKNALSEISGGSGYISNNTGIGASVTQSLYDYNNKIIDYQEQIEQKQAESEKIEIEILNSHLGEYEDRLKAIERVQSQYRVDVELSGEVNKSYISNLNLVLEKEKDKLKLFEEERAFIKGKINSKIYDPKTVDMLSEKYKDLGTEMLNVRKQYKQFGYEMADAKFNALKKLYSGNMDMIQNNMDRLSIDEKRNIREIMQLNKQKIEQEEANIRRIQELMEELNEKSKTDRFYLDKLADYNKELDKSNTLLEQHKSELNKIGEKLSSIFNPIESKVKEILTKNVELSKEAIDKNLKNFTDAIDKEIKALDDAQKRSSWNESKTSQANKINELKRQIAELSADNSSEAIAKKKEIQKQLKDEMNKSNDMLMKHNIDLKKEELNKEKEKAIKKADQMKKDLDVKLDNLYMTLDTKNTMIDGYIIDITGHRVELETALLDFEDLFGAGLSLLGNKIRKDLIDNLKAAQDLLKEFDSKSGFDGLSKSEKTINVYGSAIDLENAKNILGINGYSYIDTSLVDTTKIQFNKDDIVLGGKNTHNGVSQENIGGAIRIEGADRYDTARILRLYKDIKSGKIRTKNGIVYGNSTDLENARKYLGPLGYEFINLDDVNLSELKLSENDLVVGNSSLKPNGGTHLWGNDRYDTEEKIKNYANSIYDGLIDKNYTDYRDRYVYGNKIDIDNAKKHLSKYGYKFIETDDIRDKKLYDSDIVVGGKVLGAEKVVNAGGFWLKGLDRYATEDEVIKFERRLSGLPGVNIGGKSNFNDMLNLNSDKKIYSLINNLTKNGLINEYIRSVNANSQNYLKNSELSKQNINYNTFKMDFPNVKNDSDARNFSKELMKIMNTSNLQ